VFIPVYCILSLTVTIYITSSCFYPVLVYSVYLCIAGVFGGPLLDVMRYDMAHYHCSVPHIIKQCVELILEHGKEVEGIFR